MMTRLSSLVLLLPLLLCGQLFGQPQRSPRPWWDSELTKELNLSDAQTKQIRQTQQDFRARMFELRAAVNKSEADLQAAFDEDPVDQAKANETINRLAAAHSELTKAVSQMDLKLRTILTAQQWQDLKQRQRTRPRGPGRRGPTSTPPTATTQK
jgi:Spy/CpxP family protein refolding chaperone